MKLNKKLTLKVKLIPGIRSYALASLIVCMLGLSVTLLSWNADKQRAIDVKNEQLAEQVRGIQTDASNRLDIYAQILHGCAGLFEASDSVTRDEWRQFVELFRLQLNYPGIQAVAYSEHIPLNSLPNFQQSVRSEGFSNFYVSPAGSRPEYAAIRFIEPFSGVNRKAFGYDLFSESTRRQAMIGARDTGKITLSNKITLVQDTNNAQPGFLMFVPIYKKNSDPVSQTDRRELLRGYASAAFRASDFFSQAIGKDKLKVFGAVQIFDGRTIDRRALLYESQNFSKLPEDKTSPAFTSIVQGKNWTYRFARPLNASRKDPVRENIILVGGILLSLAVAGLLFLVMLTRARQVAYAKHNEAQQAKDDLLSLASHQLRTPATAVKQYVGMILEGYAGKINSKILPFLQKAYISNERQLETINQILYVAKADAGRLSLHKEKIDLNNLVDDILAEQMDTIDNKKQIIEFKIPRKKLTVMADKNCLHMVIENLISNACKYSYDNGRVVVRTGIKNNEVFILVKDDGVGIDEEDHDKLFKKFSRIDNELSLEAGGSGIGLYIDKILIELHGGRIEVDSRKDSGSVFTVYLPKKGKEAKNLTD